MKLEKSVALVELSVLIAQHCTETRTDTAIPGVSLVRSDTPTLPVGVVYEPMLCIVAQGSKRTLLGNTVVDYHAGQYLVVAVDLPVVGSVVQARPDSPYLAMSLTLNQTLLADLLLRLSSTPPTIGATQSALAISNVTPELLEPAVRLLKLLDTPVDIPQLAPLIEQEIMYRLLTGEQGTMLRQIALAQSRIAHVSRAIGWIRRNFAEPLRIEAVAQKAHMSASTFHRHFKAVTAMSPLQYQKQIRLQEARRLLLAGQADAASVGFAVGYESPSQFSREYARMFGQPPLRDAARLRAAGSVVEA